MKIQDKIIRKFVAEDGTEFETETACFNHEMKIAKNTVGKSAKYVIGTIYNDGTGYFQRYRLQEYKTVPSRLISLGGTSNVKYAYKFSSFEEAYKRGGDRVLTLEEAQKASELAQSKNAKKADREQRYVRVYTKEERPTERDTYITNIGLVAYEDGVWTSITGMSRGEKFEPEFWMKKVNKTAR